jgi:hypothetical protein
MTSDKRIKLETGFKFMGVLALFLMDNTRKIGPMPPQQR